MGREYSRSKLDGSMKGPHRPIHIASGTQASAKQIEQVRRTRIEIDSRTISLGSTPVLMTLIEPGAKLGIGLGAWMRLQFALQRLRRSAFCPGEQRCAQGGGECQRGSKRPQPHR